MGGKLKMTIDSSHCDVMGQKVIEIFSDRLLSGHLNVMKTVVV